MKRILLLSLFSSCLIINTVRCMDNDDSSNEEVVYDIGIPHLKKWVSFNKSELHDKLDDLILVKPDKLSVWKTQVLENGSQDIKIPLTLEELTQLKKALLSHLALDCNEDSYVPVVEIDFITPLPTKVHDAIYGPQNPIQIVEKEVINTVEAQQTLTQKLLNPTTLGFGAVCALTAYLAAKQTSSPQ